MQLNYGTVKICSDIIIMLFMTWVGRFFFLLLLVLLSKHIMLTSLCKEYGNGLAFSGNLLVNSCIVSRDVNELSRVEQQVIRARLEKVMSSLSSTRARITFSMSGSSSNIFSMFKFEHDARLGARTRDQLTRLFVQARCFLYLDYIIF